MFSILKEGYIVGYESDRKGHIFARKRIQKLCELKCTNQNNWIPKNEKGIALLQKIKPFNFVCAFMKKKQFYGGDLFSVTDILKAAFTLTNTSNGYLSKQANTDILV